jgi:hypothetical protein
MVVAGIAPESNATVCSGSLFSARLTPEQRTRSRSQLFQGQVFGKYLSGIDNPLKTTNTLHHHDL